MTDEQLNSLEAAARAATPGPWFHYYAKALRRGFAGSGVNEVKRMDREPVIHWSGFDSCDFPHAQKKRNAAYIAQANPAAIIELINAYRALSGDSRQNGEKP